MPEKPLQTLIIEDNAGYVELLKEMLRDARGLSFVPESADTLVGGFEMLASGKFDVILLDLRLPDGGGPSACEAVRAAAPYSAIVIVSASTEEEGSASECMQKGAQDYLVKGEFDRKHLWHSLRYAVQRKRIENDYTAAQNALLDANQTLMEKVNELDRLNSVMMGREERILELKEEIRSLKNQIEERERQNGPLKASI